MISSYEENNYSSLFRVLILTKQPKLVVECGVLDGFSTFYIAHALRFNHQNRDIESAFFAYDIFDAYEYKHGDYDEIQTMMKKHDLEKYYQLIECDAFEAACLYQDRTVDFLHMDISNDGDTLLRTLDIWGNKISDNGIIAFEGGSIERDQGWIRKYNKRPIRPELINNPIVYKNWYYQIFDPYPSLTLLFPKR